MENRVYVRKVFSYDYAVLRPLISGLMERELGGSISKGMLAVIKPNLLAPAPPEKAMLTHPLIVRAVAEYLIEKGARVRIADSPALGSFEKVLKESGIGSALSGLPVEMAEFRESAQIQTGEPFRKIELSRDALEADMLINLPKLKTHSQMLLTLGVKNLFGCVVGVRKPEWHFRTGVDREMFAKLLVQIYLALKPAFTILDGILAMEGQGPGKSGTPRELGLLLASRDTLALDAAVCGMLGVGPADMPVCNAAMRMGLSTGYELDGTMEKIPDFKLPRTSGLVFGPRPLHGLMRAHLVQRPVPDEDICRLCGECMRYCPVQAIEKREKKLRFDYNKCIRCYCCLEVCPYGAIKSKETLPGKLVRRIVKGRPSSK
ncbi:MAG: DUF362 domain-containing protein [Nitrospiraceae bacterium]|nr:DUF362 domain-containing protein [Nitrospiraceae bacterium]